MNERNSRPSIEPHGIVHWRDKLPRTYRLKPSTVAQIDDLSSAYGVGSSRIVELLLRVGLEQVESGQRQLQRKPVRFDVDLA